MLTQRCRTGSGRRNAVLSGEAEPLVHTRYCSRFTGSSDTAARLVKTEEGALFGKRIAQDYGVLSAAECMDLWATRTLGLVQRTRAELPPFDALQDFFERSFQAATSGRAHARRGPDLHTEHE